MQHKLVNFPLRDHLVFITLFKLNIFVEPSDWYSIMGYTQFKGDNSIFQSSHILWLFDDLDSLRKKSYQDSAVCLR